MVPPNPQKLAIVSTVASSFFMENKNPPAARPGETTDTKFVEPAITTKQGLSVGKYKLFSDPSGCKYQMIVLFLQGGKNFCNLSHGNCFLGNKGDISLV